MLIFFKRDSLGALLRICFVVLCFPLSQNSYKLPQINTHTFRTPQPYIQKEFQKNSKKILSRAYRSKSF